MCFGKHWLRDILYEFHFRLEWCFWIVCQPDTVGYTKNMCIYRHCRCVECHSQYHVGCFRPTPGMVSRESMSEGTSPSKSETSFLPFLPGFGFIIWIRARFDILKYLIMWWCSHCPGCRKCIEQSGCYHIYPLVCALCRQNHCNQQLILVFVVQFGFCRFRIGFKPV